MNRLLLIAAGICLFGASCLAEEQLQPHAHNILIEVQIVAVPQEIALPLISRLKRKETVDAAAEEIQALLQEGKATLIDWPMVTTHSGQRAVVEGINEIRYGTEFQAGGVGIYLEEESNTLKKLPTKISGVEVNAVPTSFETRNVGVTLEVEPVLRKDGKTIDLNLVPQHVRLAGSRKITVETKGGNNKITVEQPEFDVKKVTTQLSLKSGGCVLLGSFKVSEPPNHIELFILRAEVRPID